MSLTLRDTWGVIHGMGLGAVFLLAFAGGLARLWSLRPDLVTAEGVKERLSRLRVGTWLMAVVAWLTVLSGTYVVYPWYRAKPPEGADLTLCPRSLLLSDPSTAGWHKFGMEWKEHVAWIAPILATAVAYIVTRYGPQLVNHSRLRRVLMWLFTTSFAAAAVAGLFGAFITKVAPVR